MTKHICIYCRSLKNDLNGSRICSSCISIVKDAQKSEQFVYLAD